MTFYYRIMHIFYFILVLKSVSSLNRSNNPLLLLISFDGFRWDYLINHNLTNFAYLKSIGSYADHVKNTFSTVTFPNHWTIVTGLYEESHGIMQNNMYDPSLKKIFDNDINSTTNEWFDPFNIVAPIWTLNQKAGNERYSAAEWIASNINFHGINITSIDYNRSKPYNDLIDEFINLFTSDVKPINFGAIYFDEPDNIGHTFGPDTEELKNKLHELDSNLGYLIQKLKDVKLFDQLNLIITSDHGMQSLTTNYSKNVYLEKYIDISLFKSYGGSVVRSLFVKNKTDISLVYNKLKNVENMDTYYKNEFPSEFHFKENIRFGDILLVAKLGYMIFDTVPKSFNNTYKGTHGYYNNESSMFPLFIAQGPAIRKNFKIANFNIVDIYPLMCAILDLTPGENNGSISNVESILVKFSKKHVILYALISFTPIISAFLTAIFLYIINKRMNLPGQTINDNDGYKMLSTSESNLLDNNDEDNEENEP